MNRRSPIRSCRLVLVVMGVVALSGCLPKRVFWSRDGQHAVIIAGENKAYLTTADGKLSEPLDDVAGQVAWFPDSKRFAAARVVELATWEQVKKELPKDRVDKILSLEKAARQEILTHEGSFDNWQPKSAEGLAGGEVVALWIYMRQYDAVGLPEKLGSKWKDLAELKLPIGYVQIVEVQSGKMVLGKRITRAIGGIASLRVSPDGRLVAYVTGNPEIEAAKRQISQSQRTSASESPPEPVPADQPIPASQPTQPAPAEGETPQPAKEQKNSAGQGDPGGTLMVVDAEGRSQPQIVEKIAAWRPDFSADSQWLVYAAIKGIPGGDNLTLGSIERRRIVNGPGGLRVEDAQPLAGILYFPDTKIVCMENGEILFSSAPMTLPCGPTIPNSLSLFSLAPDRRVTVAATISDSVRSSLPADAFQRGMFDVRPDGGAVTFFELNKATLGYYAFASNTVEEVLKEKSYKTKLLDVPAWRNNDELSFMVEPGHEWGSPNRPELILYSTSKKQSRCISKSWPDQLMQSFMPDNQPEATQPASTPAQ